MVDYPKDWEKVKLFDLMIPYGGLSGKSSEDFKSGNKKYISYLNVFNNFCIENITEKVNIKSNERQNVVNKGDVIFTQSSETLDEVGMTSTYLGEEEVYLNSFCFGARQKREFNSVFMVLLLRSSEIRKKISKEGQGSTRYNLSPNRLMSIKLVIPPLHEQKVISETLMSFDRHIENLERLIEKKKMIRDGAVEDLMTGKIRFDGFEEEWNLSLKIGDLFTKVSGSKITAEEMEKINKSNGSITIYGGGDTKVKVNPTIHQNLNIVKDEVVIVQSRGIIDFIYSDRPCTFKNEFWGYTSESKYNIKFLFYYFKHNINDFRLAGEGRSSFPQISKKVTEEYEFPNIELEEQEAIASILTSMDEEIENLEKEKAKIEKIKAGAMDDLLTGKVRLI